MKHYLNILVQGDQRFNGHAYEKKIAIQVWSKEGDLVLRSASAPNHALAPLKEGLTQFQGGNMIGWFTPFGCLTKELACCCRAIRYSKGAINQYRSQFITQFDFCTFLALCLLKLQQKAFAPLVDLGEKFLNGILMI